ncbi:MAG: diaminopimelate decarboxylase [Parvibaculales bacterium]
MNEAFRYKDGTLHADGFALPKLAQEYGTPLYVYSASHIRAQYKKLTDALAGRQADICYAVKANPHTALIALMKTLGAGADIVSAGEMARAQKSGIAPENMVFSGIGKSNDELERAIAANIGQFNVESADELERIDTLAKKHNKKAPIAFRVNPDIAADTHQKIATGKAEDKFGIAIEQIPPLYEKAAGMAGLEPQGLAVHIGSQITNMESFAQAFAKLSTLAKSIEAKGGTIKTLDIGGGLAVPYHKDEQEADCTAYANLIQQYFSNFNGRLILEPGRFLTANAGILLSRIIGSKHTNKRNFLIIDAAMSDFMRPSLYDAHHEIALAEQKQGEKTHFDIVGPICESGDIMGRERELRQAEAGEVIAIFSTGAYGASLGSQYNSRPKAAEVLVDGDKKQLITPREEPEAKIKQETLPDWLS